MLCEPVNPRSLDVHGADARGNISPELVESLKRVNGLTWEYMDSELSCLIAHLWGRVEDNKLLGHLHHLRATSMSLIVTSRMVSHIMTILCDTC